MEEKHLIKIEEMSLEEKQLAEQLYNAAGLDPVVDEGLKDYDKRLQLENKLINKLLGPRGSDIKGYGETVAKRVALAVYTQLSKQYGGKVGDLRSYIMALEGEKDRANARYDELMGRVVGILGEEYKELRTDSKTFMERMTAVLGEDLKESRINYQALAERLADIDSLRSQIAALNEEMAKLVEKYEFQIAALKNEHNQAVESLRSKIAELDSKIERLESDKTTLTAELAQLKGNYDQLKTAIAMVPEIIPYREMRERLGEELYNFLLKDSKVPDVVIKGVGSFIDFKKYLGIAAEEGVKEASKHTEKILAKFQ